MPHIDQDSGSIYFERHGAGPLLLLTPGFLTTTQVWDRQVAALSTDWTVIVWDLPGHGRTQAGEGDRGCSEHRTLAAMSALIDAHGADRAVLAGFSLGGYVALRFWSQHPERVAGLVLCGTGPGFRKSTARAAWNDRLEVIAGRLEQHGLSVLRDPAMGPEVTGSTTHRSAQGLARAARGFARQNDARVIDNLPAVSCPTLITVGENDRRFLPACQYMHDKIPGSELAVIPAAGHAANVDNPHAFNTVVTTFLHDTFIAPFAAHRSD